MNVGVRYIHRSIPRVLEDVGPYPVGACDLRAAWAAASTTRSTNPGPSTPVLTDLGASYEKPIHNYDAVEFTVDKRFSNNWALHASYTWSRLVGHLRGLLPRRQRAVGSRHHVALRLPHQRSELHRDRRAAASATTATSATSARSAQGPLPLDRPHVIKLFGNYTFDMGLNLGVGLTMNSGAPLTALAANPDYDNGGEIPLTPRGGGFQTLDGFKTRTPFEYNTDMHADYAFKFGGRQPAGRAGRRVQPVQPAAHDRATTTSSSSAFGVTNPNFGLPVSETGGGTAVPDAAADPLRRPVRVLDR